MHRDAATADLAGLECFGYERDEDPYALAAFRGIGERIVHRPTADVGSEPSHPFADGGGGSFSHLERKLVDTERRQMILPSKLNSSSFRHIFVPTHYIGSACIRRGNVSQ